MISHLIVPTFNKSAPNKVHNELTVTGQNTVSHPTADVIVFAIATESIPATVDGEYVFTVRLDNIGDAAHMMIGVTPMETFDSYKTSYPGFNGMTGCAVYLYNGNYFPGINDNLIDCKITNEAYEVIVVITIANDGAQKLIRWIVDGTPSKTHDCTADCKGDALFPVVSLGERNQQITTIPIDQVTIRNDDINKLIEKFPKQTSSSNQGVVANNNNQQASSAAFTQLQQELEKERNRADLAESQVKLKDQQIQQEQRNTLLKDQLLQQKDQIIQQNDQQLQQKDQELQQKDQQLDNEKQNSSAKDQQLQQKDTEIDRLRQLLNPSPFVKDKFYQIDFVANGIIPPADPNAFGTLLKLPSTASSPLFNEVRSMFRTDGSWAHGTAQPVAGFELKEIEVINTEVSSLETRIRRLQQLRAKDAGTFFNPSSSTFTAEQLQTLISLRDQFLPRPSNATDKTPNLINVFHGTKIDKLDSVVHGLVAVRSTDAGFFGLGVYTTTSIEYAAKYARGDFDDKNGPYPPRASDGCVPVVWCVAAVGVCYPVTRQEDYKNRKDGNSDFFGAPLKPGYDCHCAGVSQSNGYQAVPRKEMQYMEIVFDQEAQVLPIAVLWVKEI